MNSHILCCLALLGLAATVSVAEPHGFNVHDLLAMERISDPRPSPDGRQIAFVVRTTDLEADRGRTDLWRVGIDGTGLARLTTHEAGASNPRWAPDGSGVFFLSSRSGSSQVWRLPTAGGEARQVTDLPLDVSGFEVSPDGRNLAVALEVFLDCEDLECTAKRLKEKEESKATGMVFEKLFVRHWDTYRDGRRSHLFIVPVGGGEAVDVCRGVIGDVPSKPFGGTEEMAFTPDGTGLVYAARTDDGKEAWSTDFDLWYSPVDASTAPRKLTDHNRAWLTHPVFSPDGKTLAFTAMKRPGYESDRFRLMLWDWPVKGKPRALTEGWDRSVGDYFFSADGKTIYATAQDTGHRRLFSIDVPSARVTPLVTDGTVRSPSLAGDRIVFGLDHLRSPVELHSIPLKGGEPRKLTDINGERLALAATGEAEQFSFEGWNDETVYGWVVKPANFKRGVRYPIAFLIHGGPQGSFSNNFHYRWNPQTYAGAGFAAVMIDFHGSTGYGQAFTDSIAGDWGGKPLEDLEKGLAAALDKYSDFLDGDQVCALGASYGGYMINWIAGKMPERFRCLVNHDGIFDQRMMYYGTEELWFPEWEHGGPYFERAEAYERHNPLHHVKKWRAPMLVIQGAKDYRVPETQGLATFTALQRLQVESKLLFFPDENHWVLKPANSILWHDTVLDWLKRWTVPKD